MNERTRMLMVELNLRSSHIEALEYLAVRDGVTITECMRGIFEEASPPPATKPPRKHRFNAILSAYHLSVLDKIALARGVDRSEVARSLIDQARRYHDEAPIA